MNFLLHFTDTGFCTWLADIHTPQELMNDRRLCGHIPETWVFGQICRRFLNCGTEPRLCDLKGMKAPPSAILHRRTCGISLSPRNGAGFQLAGFEAMWSTEATAVDTKKASAPKEADAEE